MFLRKEQKDHAALASPDTSICALDWQPPPAELPKSAALFQIFCNPNKIRTIAWGQCISAGPQNRGHFCRFSG